MKSTLLFIALISLHLSVFSQTWVQEDSLPVIGVVGSFFFSIDSNLYVGGGFNAISTTTGNFNKYTPATNQWTAMATLPTPIESAYGFELNGKGYMICGYNGNLISSVYAYTPATNTWTQKNDFPGGSRQNHVCFSVNGKGYLFGGFVGGSDVVNDMWQYNDTTDSWTQLASTPGPGRNNPGFLIINNQIYVGFGSTSSASPVYSDFYLFNPTTNTYTQKADIPSARTCVANFTLNNLGYIGLGLDGANNHLDDFYTYNPATNIWSQINNFGGVARAHTFSIAINGKPYVGCGDAASGVYKNDIWSFEYPEGVQTLSTSSNAISCYPSPATSAFTIDMTGYTAEARNIYIYNQLGQLVYQTISSQDKVEITDRLAQGIYTVSVKQGGKSENTKFVIK